MNEPSTEGRAAYVAPHRGAAVLTLGILGFLCFVCGIIGWVMGSADLKAMREGRMDRSGESMTTAGHICGIVSTILGITGLLVYIAFIGFIFTKRDEIRHDAERRRQEIERYFQSDFGPMK